MFRRRTFDSNVIASTCALLLLALPLSGECQSDTVQTQKPSEPIEEIVVRGHKFLINLQHEMKEAEEALYGVYNSLNADDDYDIYCYEEAPTGSKIKQRVCRPQKLGKILAEQTQLMMLGQGYAFPADEIKKMNEAMFAEMTELASNNPEYVKALREFYSKKQTWESEHKRRCEGRLILCRRE